MIFLHTVTKHLLNNEDILLFNWLNNKYAVVNDKSREIYNFLLNQEDNVIKVNKDLFTSDELSYLVLNKFIIDVVNYENEYRAIIFEKYAGFQQKLSKKISLTLLPAGEACNFNCVYCYEDHSSNKRMNDVHLDSVYNFIINSNCSVIHINYFGGEPSLNVKFILALNNKVKQFADARNYMFTSSMTTNGYSLTDKVLSNLYDCNVFSYQITVDGIEEFHNKLRPLFNGKPTYHQIMLNINNIAARVDLKKLRIIIRTNYNERSSLYESIEKHLTKLKEVINADKRFTFLFKEIGDYASLNNRAMIDKDSLCSANNLADIRRKYKDMAHNLNLQVTDDLVSLNGDGSCSCYAAKINNFVILPDFSVKKCTVSLSDPLNLIGNLSTNGVIEFNDNYIKWVANKLFKEDKCKTCHFVMQCNSNACPLINIEKNCAICPPQKLESLSMLTKHFNRKL